MSDIRNIVILTGAGISAESGLATFRGPEGLWEGHRVEKRRSPIIDYNVSIRPFADILFGSQNVGRTTGSTLFA